MPKLLKITYLSAMAFVMAKAGIAAEKNPNTNMHIALGAAIAIPERDLQGLSLQGSWQYRDLPRKSMWIYRAAIGGNISENMRAEFEFLIFDRYKAEWNYNTTTNVAAKTKLLSQTYFINGYYDFHGLIPIFTPYIGAGVGGAYNSVNNTVIANGTTINRRANYDFAWNLGFGAIYNLNENFYFDLNYRYIYAGKFKGNSVSASSDMPILRGHVYYNSFLASFGVQI